MSTKTTFKRVALVAVAALGLGVLSVAPSSATILTQSLSLASATTTGTVNDTNTAVLSESFYRDNVQDSVTVTGVITSSNAANASVKLAIAAVTDSSTSSASGYVDVVGQNTSALRLSSTNAGGTTINGTITAYLVNPTAAGTYTVTFYVQRSAAGVALGTADTSVVTWSTVVAAKDTKPAGNSTVTVRAGATGSTTPFAGTAEGTDSAVVATRSSTRGTADATVWVRLKNAAGTADESITAVISGEGFISASTTRGTLTALTLQNASAGVPIYVFSNGTAGKATLTMSTPSYSLGTKTFTFNGLVSKLAIATDPKAQTIGRTTGGYSNSSWFYVAATDASGNPVSGLTPASFTVTSSNPLAVASASVGADSADIGLGEYPVTFVTATGAKSGDKSTLTISYPDPADTTGAKKLTVTQDVTLGGSVNKVTITTDKASYTPGEQMIVTVSAVDASGNPVADGRSVPTLSSNKTITGLSNVGTTFVGGKADSIARDTAGAVTSTYRVFAPASGGEFSIYADYTDAAAASQRATVTATVADAAMDAATDAANEATDAANAATDAALAAADAADAATAAAQDASDAVAALSAEVSKMIASLKAQITTLTNLVIKIQKKVRA